MDSKMGCHVKQSDAERLEQQGRIHSRIWWHITGGPSREAAALQRANLKMLGAAIAAKAKQPK